MRKNQHKKAARNQKDFNLIMPGLMMEWFDSEPLEDRDLSPGDIVVTHRKLGFKLIARDFWIKNSLRIRSKTKMRWKIKIVGVFNWDNSDHFEERELEASIVLEDLAAHVETAVKDIIRHGEKDRFVGCHFTIECLGHQRQE